LDVRVVSTDPQVSTLAAFNAALPGAAERDVLACCASPAFAAMIADGRPYPDPATLRDTVNTAFAALSWDDIAEGMRAHPRIGDRAPDGGWSAAEQSGAAAASGTVRQALADGNLAYEQRFGHVFLICASGLSGQDMLDQLRARLAHDPETERAVVREELRKITQLRLTKLLGLLTGWNSSSPGRWPRRLRPRPSVPPRCRSRAGPTSWSRSISTRGGRRRCST
jgi:2-oxo-4-hydroxy-4-carboxy-5-ureidoimidazoline decarboxylase